MILRVDGTNWGIAFPLQDPKIQYSTAPRRYSPLKEERVRHSSQREEPPVGQEFKTEFTIEIIVKKLLVQYCQGHPEVS